MIERTIMNEIPKLIKEYIISIWEILILISIPP
jgi:hypothetical protein